LFSVSLSSSVFVFALLFSREIVLGVSRLVLCVFFFSSAMIYRRVGSTNKLDI